MSFGARASIRLGALQHNLDVIRKTAGHARVIAVVKANAYGHGMTAVAEALGGADALAVARIKEARDLRRHGIDKPIVILAGAHDRTDLRGALDLSCDLVVHNPQQVELLESCGVRGVRIWLKVDTGMHRLGIAAADALSAIARLEKCCDRSMLGVMTHFASADDLDDDMTRTQVATFRSVVREFAGDISVGNSAAIFGWKDALEEIHELQPGVELWVRPGIALYGVSPFPSGCGADLGLKPVMQFESQLIAAKPVKAGEGVGYGCAWRAPRDTVIGIVSAGYGDGYSRFCPSGTPQLINGRRVGLAGRVSMDTCAVDLGVEATERPGANAVLWGDNLPVEEIARHAGTIPYQLLSGIMHREDARYIS